MSMNLKKSNNPIDLYFHALFTRPMLTKSITAALLGYYQEILARKLAGLNRPSKSSHPQLNYLQSLGFNIDALKLAGFGGLVAAPSTHILQVMLYAILAKLEGRNSTVSKARQSPSFVSKFGLLLGSILFVSPIQNTIYIISMAILNGARSVKEIKAAWKRGFPKLTQLNLLVAPISGIFAARFLRPRGTFAFFTLLQFSLALYFNQLSKKLRLKAKGPRTPRSD
ncbi:uncharacterized protein MELLADRAFT_72064 [Melampsora larici-populina 98AG31]|uniref:Uncharacterized protein n=1 Tax=Melampsora larici-populina (strain 98AG31 / pathotype 3-4-7) TaxID=747676 RepID=F4RPC3_MELLP|nr:uncharacterized protein MELLADRAFT_72064 [Melampsora larici-populina 98AG31]EGG05791.1 hypothetical protein MELLADRAFT_72064 [Melampsora larici-populina 98AG31]